MNKLKEVYKKNYMMTQQELQQAYSRQNWQNWLGDIFGTQVQFETQAENIEIDKENIKSVKRFAAVKLAGGKNLAVLEIETRADIRIARNRVGLRELVVKFIDHARYHGILAFYHSEDTVMQGQYRLSFISSEPTIDADGNFSVQSTAPKRFTYVLGENEKTKTPAERLKIIAGKRGNATLDDIKNAFSVETLTKEFYEELSNWYFWALSEEFGITFPNDRSTEADDRQIEEHMIRLITRLMFVWFIKQKQLVPESIFEINQLKSILKDFDATSNVQDNYYRAILQNLFFATLNNRIEDRAFAADGTYYENKAQYGIKTLYRYADEFSISNDEVIKLFNKVPFLNGGLFECLDKDTPDSNGKIIYCDGFSRRKDRQSRAHIPNILFFQKDKGLIPLLSKYNFTIEENTPDDIKVALDPELLGKVFENLLGTYNPETKETARNQSGSFYTPREIVNYMVDESLKAYLVNCLNCEASDLVNLFDNQSNQTNHKQSADIYKALLNVKVLDPACGSGAFPMGVLNRMLAIIEKLPLPKSISIFELKLHLIENCIYGVDIQSIAVQISKLRFFISLICEQTPNYEADNLGIKPLPNLETKFVAANTLIGLAKRNAQGNLFEDPQIEVTKKSLLEIRHLHFGADTAQKKKEYRSKDEELRKKLARLLEANNDFAPQDAKQLTLWNPYDQNVSSPFFDTEWMFGLKDGFDIVIGNPPYLKEGKISKKLFEQYKNSPYYQGKMDLWYMFTCYGVDLLKSNGHLCFIATNNWVTSSGASKLRNKVISDTLIKQLVDFGNFMIFESASIQTMVMLFSKNSILDNYNFDYRKLAGNTVLADALSLLNKHTNNKATYLFPKIVRNDLKDKFLTFSSSDATLDKLAEKGIYLTEKEIAQGIVFPQDFLNKKNTTTLGNDFIVGQGVFALTDEEKYNLRLSEKELNLIKPYYTTEQIQRYYSNRENKLWLIYTDSSFKNPRSMINYPNLKEHLDKFASVITSDNKPYGLHRTREELFFKGEKIVAQRKCVGQPSFSYSNFDCYVSATFFVIKTNRFNLKYLVGVLNSKLIAFWLKNKGKMQGDNFQIDKEPLLQIPIYNASAKEQQPIITLVNQILYLKNKENMSVSEIVSNDIIASYFEKMIDACVYELYFEEEIKSQQVDVLELIKESLDKVSPLPMEQQILHLFDEWNDYKNEVRNRIILQETRSESVAQIIKSTN